MTEAPPLTSEAVLEVAGQQVRITLEVALAIRAALITQIEQSKLPHKQALLDETRGTTVTFSPGMARFGLWILSAPGDHMQLIFRQPSDAPVTYYHQAEVANRAGQWRVENLRVVSMRRGR